MLKIAKRIFKEEDIRKLIKSGKWSVGWISSIDEIVVSKDDSHDVVLEHYLESKGIDPIEVSEYLESVKSFDDGFARLINGTVRGDIGSGVLVVEVIKHRYKHIKKLIMDFVPFYAYFHTILFEVGSTRSSNLKEIMIKLGGEEEEKGFSLLNHYR